MPVAFCFSFAATSLPPERTEWACGKPFISPALTRNHAFRTRPFSLTSDGILPFASLPYAICASAPATAVAGRHEHGFPNFGFWLWSSLAWMCVLDFAAPFLAHLFAFLLLAASVSYLWLKMISATTLALLSRVYLAHGKSPILWLRSERLGVACVRFLLIFFPLSLVLLHLPTHHLRLRRPQGTHHSHERANSNPCLTACNTRQENVSSRTVCSFDDFSASYHCLACSLLSPCRLV